LDYFLCFSLGHLDHIARCYVRFYNEARPHQGLGNHTIPAARAGPPEELTRNKVPEPEQIHCKHFLGGLLRHYYRDAA
jgi:hypothetical protein